MKKLLFSIIAMMALCTTLSAKVIDFGVTAGMNIVQAEANDENAKYGWSSDSQNGWYAGLQLKFTFPVVGLGLDVAATYAQNESTFQLATSDQLGEGHGKLESIDKKTGFICVPLHLRWDISLPAVNYAVTPYFFTGPQANYSVKKFEDDVDQKFNDIDFNSESLVWKWDLGAGVILLKHLQVAYAYEFPLTNTTSFSYDDIKADYKMGTHRIGLTYYF